MLRLFASVFLLLLALARFPVRASPCLSFDTSFNLHAFGFNGKDWNAGTQNTWATATNATDITTTGRPPFDGSNTTCYLAQYFNAIYVLNGDARNPTWIYIYNVATRSWSAQHTTPGSFDYSSFNAVLDHDTNVFYAFSRGTLFNLEMGTLVAAQSAAIPWNNVRDFDFPADYSPVMALAENHIHFLDVGSDSPGSARIFVIHYSYLQPQIQSYSTTGSETFPAVHGQTSSFFRDSGVQQEFAFIPDNFSGTYVINVENNSTQTLPPPTAKDTRSSYVAGITSLVQLDSTGAVYFLPYTPDDSSSNANAAWTSVRALAVLAPPTHSSSSSSSPRATGTSTPDDSSHTSSGVSLSSYAVTSGLVGLSVLFAILGFL